MRDAKTWWQMNETEQTSPKNLKKRELFTAKRKRYCDVYEKAGTEGSKWPTTLEQLSEIPRALEMSAQLCTSTHSLPVTSLTTQLDTEQMPPWTLSLLNLSLHFTSTAMSWPVMLRKQTLKAHVCKKEMSLWRAWKSKQLIQPRELTEAGEGHFIPSLLATNSVSSKIGRTEHFFLFHAHLLRHGYQPTPRKAAKLREEQNSLHSVHLAEFCLSMLCHMHWSQNVQLKQVREQIPSKTTSALCGKVVQLPRAKKNAVDTIIPKYSHHAAPLDQQLLINSECRSVLKHLLLSLRPTESDEEESLCITPSRTCCKHIWQHREVPLWHNPFLCTPNIFRFSTDCQECL